ncbi:MAG: hypothetical protein H6598_05315 [Flavobacteriales bacterium]|nr:hypothetical protein [Flavobacteriales bacterium]
MITRILFILLLISSIDLTAQEDGEPTNSAIKLDFKLPTGLANRSFKTIMSGLADVDLNYVYHFEKIKLLAGVGVKYGYWNIESANFPNDVVAGRMQILSPYLNLGYRSILNEKLFLDIEFNGGYGRLFTNSNKSDKAFTQDAVILSPKVSLYLRGTDLLYFGANFGYTFMGQEFTPDNLYMQTFPAATPSFNEGKYQYFSIGFGFYAIIPTFK